MTDETHSVEGYIVDALTDYFIEKGDRPYGNLVVDFFLYRVDPSEIRNDGFVEIKMGPQFAKHASCVFVIEGELYIAKKSTWINRRPTNGCTFFSVNHDMTHIPIDESETETTVPTPVVDTPPTTMRCISCGDVRPIAAFTKNTSKKNKDGVKVIYTNTSTVCNRCRIRKTRNNKKSASMVTDGVTS